MTHEKSAQPVFVDFAVCFGFEIDALNQCLDLVRKDSGWIGMRPLADRLCSRFADLLQPGATVPETFKHTANTAGRGGFGQEARYIVSYDFAVAGNIGRHYGPSAQHSLDDNKWQTFSTRRQYKGMMLAPDILDDGMMSGKGHFAVDLQPCGEALERIA